MEGPRFLIVMGTSQSTEGRCAARESRNARDLRVTPGSEGRRVWRDGGAAVERAGVAGEGDQAAVGLTSSIWLNVDMPMTSSSKV
jgi:hypothetical protein